ncbi:hypothetical protein Tco_0931017 [Tanacetum coccineum]
MNANCSAVILKKLLVKAMVDAGNYFLIPCDLKRIWTILMQLVRKYAPKVLDFTESGDSTSIILDPPPFTPLKELKRYF